MDIVRQCLVAVTMFAVGCVTTDHDQVGADPLAGGKADNGIADDSELGRAILFVANTASEEMLDERWGVGLDRRAARNIVAHRAGARYATLAQLDAVPFVGPSAISRLSRFVRGELIDGSRPMTESYWQLLASAGRQRAIESAEDLEAGDWIGMRAVRPSRGPDGVSIEGLDGKVRDHATAVDRWMRDHVNMDVIDLDGSHSVIGVPKIYWLSMLVREVDDVVFGSSIGYFQLGCDMPDRDDDVRTFDDTVTAAAAGCELLDVNWQAHGMFDVDATPLVHDDVMEWSGY
jgi:hypothetical protein